MIRRQDISVLLLYYFRYSAIRNLLLRLQRKPVTRIIAFHEISNESRKFFDTNLRFLAENTNIVSFDAFFSRNLSTKKINVIITFDDGYKNWITYAIPVLQILGLPATFFVTSGFVDLSKRDANNFYKYNLHRSPGQENVIESLTRSDLKRIAEAGFSIGGHTLSHCNLGMLQDRNHLRNEIVEDKDRLEQMAGVRINYFAYPGGEYFNSICNVTEAVKDAGYRGAVTTIPGFNTQRTNPFLLHRELTRAAMHEQVFRARIYGNYDLICYVKRCVSVLSRGNTRKNPFSSTSFTG